MKRAWLGAMVFVSATAVVAQGCSSSSPSSANPGPGAADGGVDSAAPVTGDRACGDYASAACAAFANCGSFVVSFFFADQTTCVSRLKPKCMDTLAATGTSDTPESVEACSKALAGTSCADALQNNPPMACRALAGTVQAGGSCGDSSQCASAICGTTGASGVCGTCVATRGQSGGTCKLDQDCDYGLVCAGGTCASPGVSGAMCDLTHPCKIGFECASAACTAPQAVGAACNPSADLCNHFEGGFCNADTKQCASGAVAGAGGPCGLINGTLTFCVGGAECIGVTTTSPGTCGSLSADGAPCGAMDGGTFAEPCETFATCFNNVCVFQDSTTCK